MKKWNKRFNFILLICWVFYLCPSSDKCLASEVAQYKSKKDFSFYKVTEKDNLNSATEKFKAINCMMGVGKAPSLDTKYLSEKIKTAEISKMIDNVFSWDRELNQWAKNTEIKSLPIDVLHCEPNVDKFFNYWICYFSSTSKEILQISISCKDYKIVRKQLLSRYGKCIGKRYCETKANSLLIIKREKDYLVNIYFVDNIKTHYLKNRKQFLKKKKENEKLIKDAF